MNQEKIGKFIASMRKEKNITQEWLAEKLGVTNKTISRWETGKNMPDYSLLKDLCFILDVDVNELLGGEKLPKDKIQENSIDNLDLILKEYYRMKKVKDKLKVVALFTVAAIPTLIVMFTIIFFNYSFNNRLHITTNINEYQNVVGTKSYGYYKDKWGMSEEIFPQDITNLEVEEFKMVCDDFLDNQFLSYLVVKYDEEDYKKEIERLNSYGVEDYIGYYSVTGFTNYELLAMESDDYNGFVYAITDGKSKIIYVELIFCNYVMDIDYEGEIKEEYLPDGFNAKEDSPYRIKMLNENR